MLSLLSIVTFALSVANVNASPVPIKNRGLGLLSSSGSGSLAGSGAGSLGVGSLVGVAESASAALTGSGALALGGGSAHGFLGLGAVLDTTAGLFGTGILSAGGSNGWWTFNCPATWVQPTWYQFGYFNNVGLWVAFRSEALLIAHLKSLNFAQVSFALSSSSPSPTPSFSPLPRLVSPLPHYLPALSLLASLPAQIQVENTSHLFLGLDIALTARVVSTAHANQFGYWTSAVGGVFVALEASLDVGVAGDVDLLLGSCGWGRVS
ncbi:hypothetical protein BDY24DRAFT_183346 [Mrakia frigida]|uniref:uncharacterized protein n=1 Tax=Mrakia frigida TaxID=29902 RepID=UPI003FCC21E4